jgi:hypothetical protein
MSPKKPKAVSVEESLVAAALMERGDRRRRRGIQPPHGEFLLAKPWVDQGVKWIVTLNFRFDSLGLRITRIGIDPAAAQKAPRTITGRLLQRLPLPKWTAEFAVTKSKQLKEQAPAAWAGIADKLEQIAYEQRGPRASSAKHYAEVAEVYTQALIAHQSPTKAVADRWGKSRTLAATWVHRARKAGFLTSTEQGRAKG